ncbi:MAG: alpha/beta hydrolase [Bryobacter sp.]|nr:alpha/beta hydrolase [Bryobacter sp.]
MKLWLFGLCAGMLVAATVDLEGRKIHYTAEGQGREELLLIHGWSGNESFWLPQREAWRGKYRVVTLDLPGHGKSGMFETYSMELFVKAVEAVRAKEKLARPVLVGHSLGAIVAREHGKKYPGVARAFVFVDGSIFRLPPDEAGKDRWRQMMEGLSERFSPRLEKAVGERNVSEFLSNLYAESTPREFQLMVLGEILKTPPPVRTAAFRSMADLRLWDEAKLEQPALFLRAGKREPPGEEDYLRELFPHLVYDFVPGVSHFLQLEKPELVNEKIEKFLGSLKQ